MPNAWVSHVKAYRAKHGGSYKDAMKNSKASYKKQGGGKLAGTLVRGSIAGIRTAMPFVPYGKEAMKVLNPIYDKANADVRDWERGTKGYEKTASYKDYKRRLRKAKRKKK